MKYFTSFLILIAFAFALPASIKTEYKNNIDERIDLSLTARKFDASTILLTWEPEGDVDVLGYEVQRYVDTGRFRTIAFVPALGGGKSRNFQYIDSPATPNQKIYRVERVNVDNSRQLSKEISIQFDSDLFFTETKVVHRQKAVEVNFNTIRTIEAALYIYDAAGQKIYSTLPQWYTHGEHKIVWERKDLAGNIVSSGHYVIELKAEEGSHRIEAILE